MNPSTGYKPASSSLAAQVGAYLKIAGTSTVLTTADVARRFQVPTTAVQASLEPAVRADFLHREVVHGSAHYRAGKMLAGWTPETAPSPTAKVSTPPSAETGSKPKRAMVKLSEMPDPTTLQISDNVPLPEPRSANVTSVFEPVYLKLNPGESFAVPADKQKVFQRMGVELGRKHGRRFACRQLPDSSVRVWRLADDAVTVGRRPHRKAAGDAAAPAKSTKSGKA